MTYSNPVIPGFHPDPSVCRVGDDYYLVTSSFEYFPGVPLFHSRDLVHWTKIGHVLTRPSQLELTRCGASGGIYAPTIRHYRGRFYMVTTNVSHRGNFVVWTDDLRGEWSDPVWIDAPGIDPSLLFDGDRVWYTGNGNHDEPPGIYGFEIDLATGQRRGPRTCFWNGTGAAHPEGPHLYHIRGWYYLLISEGGTEHGHMITLARSRHPEGPYEPCPHNPVLTNRSLRTPLKAVGHADLVEGADGRWWAVCLAIRPFGYPETHHLGRETNLVAVTWDDEGWPVFGGDGHLAAEVEVAGNQPATPAPTEVRDAFTSPRWGLEWTFLRRPSPDVRWAGPGGLELHGNEVCLDDQDTPAFLGRRVAHPRFQVVTSLTFDPQAEGDEAGLTVLMNHRHHYEVALAHQEGRRVLLLRRRIGSLRAVEALVPWAETTVELGLDASPETLRFWARIPGGQALMLGEGETRYLSTEVGGAFTGTFVGPYATGHGHRCVHPARFAWFEYRPLS